MLLLRLGLSLAIAHALCQESRDPTGKSPGKTPGFLRDFSGMGRKGNVQEEKILYFDSYKLDLEADQLWRNQENVKLTPKALAVLCLLVTRPGQVVTKDEFFQTVWSDTVVSDD